MAVVDAEHDAGVVFDPFSADFYADPHAFYPRLRAEAPVFYNAEYDFYALSRHEDVAAGLKDFATYSSCLLYTSPSPRDGLLSRMPSSA